MIKGTVNEYLEAIVSLSVRDATGQVHEFEAIIDTGFSGSLTLPISTIAAWELPYRTHAQVELGDGTIGKRTVTLQSLSQSCRS